MFDFCGTPNEEVFASTGGGFNNCVMTGGKLAYKPRYIQMLYSDDSDIEGFIQWTMNFHDLTQGEGSGKYTTNLQHTCPSHITE